LQKAKIWHKLPKPIIRPWEELVHNKHIIGLGNEKDVSFHIPDYSNPIQFHSVGFLHDSSPSPVPDYAHLPQQPQHILKLQQCDRVGHMKDNYADLYPCENYHKTTHSSNKCFQNKPPARTKIHLEWIAPWEGDSTTKNIFKSYARICSKVLKSLGFEFSLSSHLVSDKGGSDGHLQASKSQQPSLNHNLNLLPN